MTGASNEPRRTTMTTDALRIFAILEAAECSWDSFPDERIADRATRNGLAVSATDVTQAKEAFRAKPSRVARTIRLSL